MQSRLAAIFAAKRWHGRSGPLFMTVTRWQSHTVRDEIGARPKKKLGLTVTSDKSRIAVTGPARERYFCRALRLA